VLVAVMTDRAGPLATDTSISQLFLARHNHPVSTTRSAQADAIVLGLGAMGSAVACRLARHGLRVIGIDRHHPPHDRGSTHGDTRITRLAIGEGPEYAPLVRRSHVLWRELEAETGATLMRQVGGLVIGDADDRFLAETRANAALNDIAHENLTHVALTERFPMFAAPAGAEAYLEPEAGLLHPEAAVRAQLSLAQSAGAELRPGTEVGRWHSDGDGVTVVTDEGTLHARELVLCAGAWIPRLAPEYADLFEIHRQLLHWFPIRQGYEALRRMPIFIWEIPGERDDFTHLSGGFYGFPAIDGPGGGVKLATERYEQAADPDEPLPAATGAREAARLYEEHIARLFPWVGATPLRTAPCLYTNTRGSRFLIGPHPERPHVTVVAACSGHGFKHSPAIGEAVAQLLTGGASAIDLTPFALPSPSAAGSPAPVGSA
jgi:sarcosine oxidase